MVVLAAMDKCRLQLQPAATPGAKPAGPTPAAAHHPSALALFCAQVLLVLQAIRAKEEQLSNQRHVLETLTGLEDQVGAAGWCASTLCTGLQRCILPSLGCCQPLPFVHSRQHALKALSPSRNLQPAGASAAA